MNRKKFLSHGLKGSFLIAGIPSFIGSCLNDTNLVSKGDCSKSPRETAGPFPIKTPAELVKENIISDRKGIPLLIKLDIVKQSDDCKPLGEVLVDIWQCDAKGLYSEYGGNGMQPTDLTQQHFLRGRQMTDALGKVSFISIYPGWYRGRAPHIHLEVLTSSEKSILVTQIAFPEDISSLVYQSTDYKGPADTSNARDNIFSNSLQGNLADTITGNPEQGYTLTKRIVV